VTTTSSFLGIFSSMFFKLLERAPLMCISLIEITVDFNDYAMITSLFKELFIFYDQVL